MEAKEKSKKEEPPLSLSQILLSTNNPFASSTKDKISSQQSRKRPVGPTSKYEFVQIVADNPEKHKRPKKTKRVADVDPTNKTEVLSSPKQSSPATEKAQEVEASSSREHYSFINEKSSSNVTHHFQKSSPAMEKAIKVETGFSREHPSIINEMTTPSHVTQHVHKYSPALEKAKMLEAGLSQEHPSFIKEMTPLDVTDHFFMRFPRQFSNLHLPAGEVTLVILEDEKGKQYKTKYLPHWAALSAGWRHFTIVKSLREHDVVVFHLIQPFTFKVYILRPDDFDPVDKHSIIRKPIEYYLEKKRGCKKRKEHTTVVRPKVSQKDVKVNNLTPENRNIADSSSLITDEDRFSKTLSSIRKFKIIIENKTIDPEIPKQIRSGYFNLCHTRKTLLHHDLIKGINKKLAASIISETTNIADAITNSEISTPREDIAYWNAALQSFEFLGMDVGFIRARLDRLLEITRELSKSISSLKKNKNDDDDSDLVRIEEEIKEYEKKVEELKLLKKKLEMRQNESVEEVVERFKVMYKEEAKAPW